MRTQNFPKTNISYRLIRTRINGVCFQESRQYKATSSNEITLGLKRKLLICIFPCKVEDRIFENPYSDIFCTVNNQCFFLQFRHAHILAANGITSDKPLNPKELATLRAERIAKEKAQAVVSYVNIYIEGFIQAL